MYIFDLTYEEIATGLQTVLTIRADRLDMAKAEASERLGDGYQYIRSRGSAWSWTSQHNVVKEFQP